MRSPFPPWMQLVTLFLALQVPVAKAFIRAICGRNATVLDFEALPALFGGPIPQGGLAGLLVEAKPSDACRPIEGPPNATAAFIVLIPRYGCSFAAKVFHAQQAGFRAAIVHNVNSQALVHMVSERVAQPPLHIPAVFTAEVTSKILKQLHRAEKLRSLILVPEYFHYVWRGSSGSARVASPCQCRIRLLGPDLHMMSFYAYCIICVVSVLITVLLIEKCLSRCLDGKLKGNQTLSGHGCGRTFSFTSSRYQECAICLEKYTEHDSLKVLSCSHAFHSRCIDLWHITQARSKTCPLCMQKVMVVTRLQAVRLWRDGEKDNTWTLSLGKGRAASNGQRCFLLLSQQLPSQF
ncbi:E3 ubiquitin-protein ligase RNF167-like [Anolis sagrei]|uniref:E3 ubiquitin-protein ligase RNF167-like n=1 Tax=Anolis sagrei TaxID=38937 RepID=UPI003522714D